MTNQELVPLVDCDLLVYRGGFSCKPGEPIGNSLYAVRSAVEMILEVFPNTASDALFSISGPTNFRNDVATLLPYKGNRDKSHKPEFYKEIKEYLIQSWGAVPSENEEPDDVLGRAQDGDTTCIVSTDKDMLMIPGYHYNWVKKEFRYQSQLDADQFFWYQMMTGDKAVDNIPGVKGIGDKKASLVVSQSGGDINLLRDTVEQMYNREYGADWLKALDEVGTLLWIRRKNYETWRSYFDRESKNEQTSPTTT